MAAYEKAYREAMAADDAFHAELVKVYGARNAGDARYDRTKNRATEALAKAADAKMAADKAMRDDR